MIIQLGFRRRRSFFVPAERLQQRGRSLNDAVLIVRRRMDAVLERRRRDQRIAQTKLSIEVLHDAAVGGWLFYAEWEEGSLPEGYPHSVILPATHSVILPVRH